MKNIPHIQNKIRHLQDYLKERFFSEFLIIGASQDEERREELRLENDRMLPETLFMCPGENPKCERRNVIKDFCFPCGIPMQRQSTVDDIRRQLMKDRKHQHNSSYVFSLSGTQGSDGAAFTEILCLCTTFNDFVVSKTKKEIYLTEKCFCFMFANKHLKMQLKVLLQLKNIYLEYRLSLLKSACGQNATTEAKIVHLIQNSNLSTNVSDEMRLCLNMYYNLAIH